MKTPSNKASPVATDGVFEISFNWKFPFSAHYIHSKIIRDQRPCLLLLKRGKFLINDMTPLRVLNHLRVTRWLENMVGSKYKRKWVKDVEKAFC